MSSALQVAVCLLALLDRQPWVGKKVMPRIGAMVTIGEREVPPHELTSPPYVVLEAKGDRLRIEHEVEAWIPLEQVVSLEDAPAYFEELMDDDNTKGWAYASRGEVRIELGDYDKAVEDFSELIREDANSAFAYQRRGTAWYHQAKYDEAIKDFSEALRIDANYHWAYDGRGVAYERKGDFANALKDYDEAYRHDPNSAISSQRRGDALKGLGRLDEAIEAYGKAIQLDPKDPYAFEGRGDAHEAKGDHEKAVQDYEEASRLDPKSATSSYSRGDALRALGRIEEAITAYEKAIELDAKEPYPMERLARIRATWPDAKFRDGTKAVQLATDACKLSDWKNYWHLGTLATAYAEIGDFDAAMKWEAEAEKHAPEDAKDPQAHNWRMALYKLKKPYREGLDFSPLVDDDLE